MLKFIARVVLISGTFLSATMPFSVVAQTEIDQTKHQYVVRERITLDLLRLRTTLLHIKMQLKTHRETLKSGPERLLELDESERRLERLYAVQRSSGWFIGKCMARENCKRKLERLWKEQVLRIETLEGEIEQLVARIQQLEESKASLRGLLRPRGDRKRRTASRRRVIRKRKASRRRTRKRVLEKRTLGDFPFGPGPRPYYRGR